MTRIGRNDPCPCGSGLKYKKCCLAKAATTDFTASERHDLLDQLWSFVDRAEFASVRADAEDEFWTDRLEDLSDDEVDWVMDLALTDDAFYRWFALDRRLEGGETLADVFLARHGARLRSGERQYLERARRSHLRPFEVVDVSPEGRVELLDLWSRQRVTIGNVSQDPLVRWDVIAARLVSVDADAVDIDGAAYRYSPLVRDVMMRALRLVRRRLGRHVAELDDSEFFKRAAPLLHRLWLDRVAFPPPARLFRQDVAPLVQAVFDVHDREALVAALDRHPDLRRDDVDTYEWIDSADSAGTFVFEDDHLVLETLSARDAERGRELLASIAGDAVAYRGVEDVEVDTAPSDPPSAADRERLLRQFYETHYREWPDTALPALGGHTPREAATLATGRPKLVAILKALENRTAHQRRSSEYVYDASWLWDELGLERPSRERA